MHRNSRLVSSPRSLAARFSASAFTVTIAILAGHSADATPSSEHVPQAHPAKREPRLAQAQGGSCHATTWKQGAQYHTKDVVHYSGNGRYYVATHDNPGYDPTISTWFWSSTTCGGSGGGGGDTGGGGGGDHTGGGGGDHTGGGGSGVAALLSESTFNTMFPHRNHVYSYQGLVQAASSYAAFATTGDTAARKREIAAFLANVAHETGGLVYSEEINKSDYCSPSASCPCAPGHRYFGRGPLQLSWNYNYCVAGNALHLPLQAHPELVSSDAKVAWQTGLWFWMTSKGAGSQTGHSASVNGQFGETIRTINGALECNGRNTDPVHDRVQYFQRFCKLLGVDPGNKLSC
jgi:predicted chitinase